LDLLRFRKRDVTPGPNVPRESLELGPEKLLNLGFRVPDERRSARWVTKPREGKKDTHKMDNRHSALRLVLRRRLDQRPLPVKQGIKLFHRVHFIELDRLRGTLELDVVRFTLLLESNRTAQAS